MKAADKTTKTKPELAPDPTVETAPKDGETMADAGDAAASPAASPESGSQAPTSADERLLRLQADFDNFRKRVLREKEDLYRRANEDIMEALFPVMDHLELALSHARDAGSNDSIVQGFRMVGEQLSSTMTKFGLTPITTDGVAFDPNVHEAILQMPSAEIPENHVVSRTRAGYMLGNRVLRAAQVVISSGAPGSSTDQGDGNGQA
ncbi:MAG TPA: nucleotide exchange factor GrpE [Verrucomicrobia bacterium]|nr:nucleotide exchange factor GrpE [Verrucomicrobiota bacterium]